MTPPPLLRQNSELRQLGIYNFTLPAWVTRLPDGRTINVCPQAGACVKLCYARNGTYNFPNVKAAHQRNLQLTLDDLGEFTTRLITELDQPRFRKKRPPHLPNLDRGHLHPHVAQLLDEGAPIIRIHDSGDFYSDDYTHAWAHIATLRPDTLFYAYTKEVTRTRRILGTAGPPNLLLVYSLGGKEDHLLDLTEGGDQHADVFPNEQAITDAGYYNQDPHDLLSVVAPSTRIGIPANPIPHINKKMGGQTFGQIEQQTTRHHRNKKKGNNQ